MLAFIFSFALMAATEAPVSAEPAKPDARTTAELVRKDPNRQVCRRETKAASRMTTKVCKTAAEWDAESEAARADMEALQNRRSTIVPVTNGR